MLVNNCRLCGSNNVNVLYRRKFYPIRGVSFFNQYDVSVCKRCGFGFANEIPGQNEFDNYYKETSMHEGHIVYERSKSYYDFYVNTIRSCLRDYDAKILDLGCGMGDIISILGKKGYKYLTGVDASQKCCEHLMSIGINSVCSTINEFTSPEKFDVVFFKAVLEHICDLSVTMEKLASLLKEDGYLIIVVPDAAKFSAYEHPPYQEFNFEHINYFTKGSLSNIATLNGMKQVQTIEAPLGAIVSVMQMQINKSDEITFDASTEDVLSKYISESKSRDAEITRRLFECNRRHLIIWGLGAYTRHLLADGAFSNFEILAFVDKNPHYHSKGAISVNGKNVPIYKPDEYSFPENIPICVVSQNFSVEICREIRDKLKLQNDIIDLFP